MDLGLRADVDASRGLVDDQESWLAGEPFASTTFCWLPPESDDTEFDMRPYLTWSRLAQSSAELPFVGGEQQAVTLQPPERRKRDVVCRREIHHEPMLAAILGYEPDPRRHRGYRRAPRRVAPQIRTEPAS